MDVVFEKIVFLEILMEEIRINILVENFFNLNSSRYFIAKSIVFP